MAYHLYVRNEANDEALEAYLYYEDILDGLGEKFLDSLNAVYQLLMFNPYYFSMLREENKHIYRDVKIKDFPYVVIYEIEEQTVWVYTVHNTYKRPTRFH